MDAQIISLLNDKIDKVDARVGRLESSVSDVGQDVKEMLKFKWQIIGGSVEKVNMIIEWVKDNWAVIAFVAVYLVEQILPKINKVEANSTSELIAEVFKLIVKVIKKDYSQPKPEDKA
jgi:hypothetical protein